MRVLGLDISHENVKAVELETSFGRYEILEYHEIPLPSEDPMAGFETAGKLIHSLPVSPDRIAVSLNTSHLTFRNLEIPSKNKKVIESSIAFELEDELPLELDEMVYAHTIKKSSKSISQVYVQSTKKDFFEETLKNLKAFGVDPDLITSETWAYRTLLKQIQPLDTQKEPSLLIHMDQKRTSFHVNWNGHPFLDREISWGGFDLTDAISKKYDIPYSQADALKVDQAVLIPKNQRSSVSKEKLEFSDLLYSQILDLIWEMRQVEFSFRTITKQYLKRVYITGEGSLIRGLSDVIESELKIPCQPLQAMNLISKGNASYSEDTDASLSLALANALCFIGSEKTVALNFRKDHYAKKSSALRIDYRSLKRPLLSLGAISFCMLLSIIFQSSDVSKQLKEVDQRLSRSLKVIFPDLSSSAERNMLRQPGTLKNKIREVVEKQKSIASIVSSQGQPSIDFLKDLSQALPKSIQTDLLFYQVGSSPESSYSNSETQELELTFLLDDPKHSQRILDLLKKYSSNLKITKNEKVTMQGKQRIKVTYQGTLKGKG